MDRSDLLCRLRVLSNEYNWRQLGVATSTALIDSEDNVFCKPCNTNEACACCPPSNENTYNSPNRGQVDSPSPVLTSRKGRRAVVIDSDDEVMRSPLCSKSDPNQRQTPVILSDSSDKEEVLCVPASARSKSKHIILSDSEEETPSGSHTARPINTNSISKRIFDEEDTDSNILDAESIEESVDQVLSVDGSEDELSDHDDWIVNTSEEEEEENGAVDSDLSNSDDSFYDFNTHRDKENQPNNIDVSVPRAKPPSATPRKAHFVDLSDSPQSPPRRKTPAKTINKTPNKGTERKTSAITPKSNKKGEIAFTPVRKMSQIALNAQRVDALSTGKKKFKTVCTQLAQDLYHMYNEIIFDNQLPADLPVVWSKRLLTTAGICRCRKVSVCGVTQRTASIELSTKVLDDEERLKSTLVHEMCHAANHLIDQLDDAHHGKAFKKWGKRATKQFPEMSVTTCHNYVVHMPHKFKCTNSTCGVVYSRHTKKGINLDKQRCGVCRGELAYQGIADKDGNIAKPRQATGFSVYVKEHFARVKAELSTQLVGSVQGTTVVMRELAAQYKVQKDSSSGTTIGATTSTSVATRTNNTAKRALVDLTYNESGDEHSSARSSGYNTSSSGGYGEVEVLEVSDTDIDTDIDMLQNNIHTLVL